VAFVDNQGPSELSNSVTWLLSTGCVEDADSVADTGQVLECHAAPVTGS